MLRCVAGFFLEIETIEGITEGRTSVIGHAHDVVTSTPSDDALRT